MGTFCTLYSLSPEKFEKLKENPEGHAYYLSKEYVDLGKMWVAMSFVLGDGNLSQKPFIDLFTPPRSMGQIDPSNGRGKHAYLEPQEVEKLFLSLQEIDDDIFFKRAESGKKLTHKLEVMDWHKAELVEELYRLFKLLKALFKKSTEEKYYIVSYLG